MKKSLLIPIFLGVFVIAVLLLLSLKKNKIPDYGQAPKVSLEEVTPEARDTQYMLNHLVRGYITEQTDNAITVQTDQFITTGQEIEFKLSSSQTVFCWPSQKNGIDISQSLLTLPEGANLYLKDELETTFSQLANLENKYALVQIDDQGAISKLVILSCFND
jgi:hypothetical protein